MRLTGASMSGIGTCLVARDYKLVLDLGYCSPEAVKYQDVLITHAHIDHLAGAASHAATRDLRKLTPSRFICHPEVGKPLGEMLALWHRMQGQFNFEIVYLSPGQTHQLTGNRFVKAFQTFHRLPSQGYILYETKKKLKPEYYPLIGSPEKLAALVRDGFQVNDVIEAPLLAYTGDTTYEALENPDVQAAKVLIAECTFVGSDQTVEQARAKGHTHLQELRERVEGRTCEDLYLCHFSDRYSKAEITAAVNEGMQATATLMLDSEGPVRWE